MPNAVLAFSLATAYRRVFLEDVDMPGDYFFAARNEAPHVNRQGRKNYARVRFNEYGDISTDCIHTKFDNGLTLSIWRKFKRALSYEEYVHLSKKSSYSEIRPHIVSYNVSFIDSEHFPHYVVRAIQSAYDSSFSMRDKDPSGSGLCFTSKKVRALNVFLGQINALPEWNIETFVDDNSGFSHLPLSDLIAIPWIRRRDKKFKPEKVKIDGYDFIKHETRTILFENCLGMRIQRIFKKPLHNGDYESYKTKHKKTLQTENDTRTDLFLEQTLNLLDCVQEYRYFPVVLVHPIYTTHIPPSRIFPYMTIKAMQDKAPGCPVIESTKLQTTFNELSMATTTSAAAVSLSLLALKKLPSHIWAIPLQQFRDITEDLREIEKNLSPEYF